MQFWEMMAETVNETNPFLSGNRAKVTAAQCRDLHILAFDLFDTDASGKLSFTEFSTGLMTVMALFTLIQEEGQATPEGQLDYAFTCMDVDGSGYLEFDEIVAFAKIIRKLGGVLPEDDVAKRGFWYSPLSPEGLAKEWMAASDANRDGKISREEFNKILGPRIKLDEVVTKIAGKVLD